MNNINGTGMKYPIIYNYKGAKPNRYFCSKCGKEIKFGQEQCECMQKINWNFEEVK